MRILLLGAGAVGEAYGLLLTKADPKGDWLEKLVVADYSLERAQEVTQKINDPRCDPALQVDAAQQEDIKGVLEKYGVDLLMNGCPQHFNVPIFEAAFAAGCQYIDMAMTLSEKHPHDPYNQPGVLLGDYQYARHQDWQNKGQLALLGMGIDPGVSEVFAKYAELHLFDEIDRIKVRDGANMAVRGKPYATQFSVWSVIEECLNPPLFWSKDKGYHTGKPMSRTEVFDFPIIGPTEVVAIEHEEVINLPRWINKGLKEVDFKICLGEDLMNALKVLDGMGLSSAEPVEVKGVEVAPRDLVEVCAPDPAKVGPKMTGQICVGVQVEGRKDGKDRKVFIYQVSDNQECMRHIGSQAVAAQTAMGAAIASELLATSAWQASGVLPPEAFDPGPFLERMPAYGFPYHIRDSWKD